MYRTLFNGAAIALALMAGACGSGTDAPNQAASANDMNAMVADPNNPFAQAEMQMNERMMAAIGTDAGDSWARKMIEHHQGAIAMSEIVLAQNPSPDVARMATETIAKQRKDIADIREFVKDGAPNPQSAELYRPAMMDMHQKMMAASGADVSETFIRKMLEHHRGGVAMSDVALRNGVSGALREQVQKTRSEQQKDADHLEAMLAGQAHSEPAAAPAAAAPETSATRSEPADPRPAPASRPGPPPAKPAPAAKPDAPAEPSPSSCPPEHRAAGHC